MAGAYSWMLSAFLDQEFVGGGGYTGWEPIASVISRTLFLSGHRLMAFGSSVLVISIGSYKDCINVILNHFVGFFFRRAVGMARAID